MPLAKSEAMKEIVRCGKDPVYFLTKYAKITEPMRGLIPFDLYPSKPLEIPSKPMGALFSIMSEV